LVWEHERDAESRPRAGVWGSEGEGGEGGEEEFERGWTALRRLGVEAVQLPILAAVRENSVGRQEIRREECAVGGGITFLLVQPLRLEVRCTSTHLAPKR